MILRYTSRTPADISFFHEKALPEPNTALEVYRGSFVKDTRPDRLLGRMERRADGIYFVPNVENIGGTLVRKSTDEIPQNGTPTIGPKKLTPDLEALEIFDVDKNPIGTIELADFID